MIPKIIHQIWLGDQSKRPNEFIKTWVDMNPSWKHILWTESNIPNLVNQIQFDAMNELAGKADILRYELLYYHGGFFVDADSECIKALDNNFLQNDLFCCWENEIITPKLMSNGYLACTQKSKIMVNLIAAISQLKKEYISNLPDLNAWKVVGPVLLTNIVNEYNKSNSPELIKIYPSHYFIPKHYSGLEHFGDDQVYAKQYWGSTSTVEGKAGMQY